MPGGPKQAFRLVGIDSRLRACEEIEYHVCGTSAAVIPAKAGIHFSRRHSTLAWVPASAGTTLRPGFQAFLLAQRFFYMLIRGDDGLTLNSPCHSLFANFFTRSCAGMTPRKAGSAGERVTAAGLSIIRWGPS